MADRRNKVPDNKPGEYYVDHECIDCDLCREVAPDSFERNEDEGYSYVHKQPETDEERERRGEGLEEVRGGREGAATAEGMCGGRNVGGPSSTAASATPRSAADGERAPAAAARRTGATAVWVNEALGGGATVSGPEAGPRR